MIVNFQLHLKQVPSVIPVVNVHVPGQLGLPEAANAQHPTDSSANTSQKITSPTLKNKTKNPKYIYLKSPKTPFIILHIESIRTLRIL